MDVVSAASTLRDQIVVLDVAQKQKDMLGRLPLFIYLHCQPYIF